jgi:hypothetical protein
VVPRKYSVYTALLRNGVDLGVRTAYPVIFSATYPKALIDLR